MYTCTKLFNLFLFFCFIFFFRNMHRSYIVTTVSQLQITYLTTCATPTAIPLSHVSE